MISGIYKIENLYNGMIYIGRSTDIDRRWWQHNKDLENNVHHNKNLQNDWNSYGKEVFLFSILESGLSESELESAEQEYIDSVENLYNISKNSKFPPIKRKVSEETRDKMRNNSARYWKGKKLSKETRRKMSESRKGRVTSKDTRDKISASLTGRTRPPVSQETRDKLSMSQRGRIPSPNVVGEKSYLSKLRDEDVIEMRSMIESGEYSQKEVSDIFKVSPSAVSLIINRKRWKHI